VDAVEGMNGSEKCEEVWRVGFPGGGKHPYRSPRAVARILAQAGDHSSPGSCFLRTEEDDDLRLVSVIPKRYQPAGLGQCWAALVGYDQVSPFLFFSFSVSFLFTNLLF
jgi:hypothetical protein